MFDHRVDVAKRIGRIRQSAATISRRRFHARASVRLDPREQQRVARRGLRRAAAAEGSARRRRAVRGGFRVGHESIKSINALRRRVKRASFDNFIKCELIFCWFT
jgi:hypothetical protein